MQLLRNGERAYLHPLRLADVMGLIQVLALDPDTHRSEDGLRSDLQANPLSGDSWTAVAREHPEFFRVNPDAAKRHPVSLIARHVSPRGLDGRVPSLTADHIDSLLRSAIDMHDRQVRRNERWTYLVPIWVALIVGLFSVATSLLKSGTSAHI